MRRTVDKVLGYDERCAKDWERVGAFLGEARAVESGQQPGRDSWEKKAPAVADECKAIREEVLPRRLAAHLAAFGAGPDGVEE